MAGLNFEGLARQLLASAETHLASWLPGGRKRGTAWVAGDLTGAEGQSLKVNLTTGAWADFATGEHGSDLVSLYAAIHSLPMGDAYRQLGGEARPQPRINGHARHAPAPAEPVRRVVVPVPAEHAECACAHVRFGRPSALWTYRDAAGEVLGYVARYEPAGERKQIVPWTWDGQRWGMGQWPSPRPLYGLQELAERPGAAVLVVEGEKAADAAKRCAGPYVVVTWPAGAMAADKADWTPLAGRKVLLWPDADDPGRKAMERVAQIIHERVIEVKVLDVSDKADGWDAADADFSGWNECKPFMIQRASVWRPSAAVAVAPTPSANQIIDADTGEIEALPPEFSDDSLALDFVANFGAGLRWTPGMGWMHNEITHWKRDDHLIRFDLARRAARSSAMMADAKIRKSITSAKTVNAILFLAQSDPAIVVPAAKWDNDPLMINTQMDLWT